MAKEFLEGNFAMAEAAVRAGVEAYFGYPITPQTEILEWMSHRMPELSGRSLPERKQAPARLHGNLHGPHHAPAGCNHPVRGQCFPNQARLA